jgi:CheY-like chemotaxis protein
MTLRRRWGLRGIALSGYGTEADVTRTRQSGFAEHLTKPVDLETLLEAIERVTAPQEATAVAGIERQESPSQPALPVA